MAVLTYLEIQEKLGRNHLKGRNEKITDGNPMSVGSKRLPTSKAVIVPALRYYENDATGTTETHRTP